MGETFVGTIIGNLSLDKPPGGPPRPWLWIQLLLQGEREPGMWALEPTALLGKPVEVGEGFPSTSFKARAHPAPCLCLEFPGLLCPSALLSPAPTLMGCPYLRLPVQGSARARLVPGDLCPAFLAHLWEFRGKPQRETKPPWLLLQLRSGRGLWGRWEPFPSSQ